MKQLQRVVTLEQQAERVRGVALRLGHHPNAAGTAGRMTLMVVADAAAVVNDLEPGGEEFHRLVAVQARVRLAMRVRAEFADMEPDEDSVWNRRDATVKAKTKRNFYAASHPRGFRNEMAIYKFPTKAEREAFVKEGEDSPGDRQPWAVTIKEVKEIRRFIRNYEGNIASLREY